MTLRPFVVIPTLLLTFAVLDLSNAIEKDEVTGNCQDLAKHITNVGVQDDSGDHPNWPGHTHSTFSWTSSPVKQPKKSTKTRFYCSASNTYYDAVTECQKPPSAGGCRTVLGTTPCVPKGSQVCLEGDVTFTFSGAHTSTRLKWDTKKQSSACKKDVTRWYQDIETHEKRHVKDAKALVAKWTKDHKKKTLLACGETEAEALKHLSATIESVGLTANDALAAANAAAGDAFHAEPDGGPAVRPDCAKCK